MIRRPPRSTPSASSAASDVYKRQLQKNLKSHQESDRNCQQWRTRRSSPLHHTHFPVCQWITGLHSTHVSGTERLGHHHQYLASSLVARQFTDCFSQTETLEEVHKSDGCNDNSGGSRFVRISFSSRKPIRTTEEMTWSKTQAAMDRKWTRQFNRILVSMTNKNLQDKLYPLLFFFF